MRSPVYFNQFEMYLTYFGILIIIFFLSFVASLTVEIPFLNLDKLLFPDKITSTKVSVTFYTQGEIVNIKIVFLINRINKTSAT